MESISMTTTDFHSYWKSIRPILNSIVKMKPFTTKDWQFCITDIHDVCTKLEKEDGGFLLYKEIKKFIREYVDEVLMVLSKHPRDMIEQYNIHWQKFRESAEILHILCCNLNKHIGSKSVEDLNPKTSASVGNMALRKWKRGIITPLHRQLRQLCFEAINNYRNGCAGPRINECHEYIKSLISLDIEFQDIVSPYSYTSPCIRTQIHRVDISSQIYVARFELPFLEETKRYYTKLLSEDYADLDCSVYMKKVLEKIDDEKLIAMKYLHISTVGEIENLCYQLFVESQLARFNSVCREYIENDEAHQDDLRSMRILLREVRNGVIKFLDEFGSYVVKVGKEIILSITPMSGGILSDPNKFITGIFVIYDKYVNLVDKVFDNDQKFMQTLDKALQIVTNYSEDPKQLPKSGEALNRYIDTLLRKGKKYTESEVDAMIKKAMIIFRYIADKDMFKARYEKMLSNRLIADLTFSVDMEESVIKKLKDECGSYYTSNIEVMFKDMEISSSIMDKYQKENSKECELVDLSVRILTSVYWPITLNKITECKLPKMMADSFAHFEAYYVSKYNGRRINVSCGLGNVDMKAMFYGKDQSSANLSEKKVLNVSTYQGILLLCFNERPLFTFKQLLDETQIPEKDLTRCVQSLAMGKLAQRILSRNGSGKDIEATDEFSVNDAFTSKLKRVKVQLVTGRMETEPEVKETRAKVDEDRKHEIEATIVRVMKARKRLGHNELFAEVIDQLKSRFLPDPVLLKKRVESLIEREYLARDAKDNKEYIYVS